MGIILWIIFGAIVGWLASAIMKSGGGVIMDIVLGIVGALVGGFLVNLVGGLGITGFNIYSFLVALLGAIILIWIGRMFKKES